jgi:hypothetical protein
MTAKKHRKLKKKTGYISVLGIHKGRRIRLDYISKIIFV